MLQASLRPRGLSRRRVAMALPLLGSALWHTGAAAVAGRAESCRTTRVLMGTQVDMVAEGPDGPLLRHAMDRAYAEMQRLEALMSRYQPQSVVRRIQLAAGITPVAVPPEVMAVLQSAQRVWAQSGGAFDVTVGAFTSWNFGPGAKVVPEAAELARQRPLVGAQGLVLDNQAGTAFLVRQGMALDLGGIAKLPILEAGMKVLRSEGVENAMVNGGGDVLTQGLWQGRPWRVGLRDPRSPERLLGVVAVAGSGVVASSGDYERFFFHAGQRQHHVLNPRTGRPTSGVHGVSLVARDVAAVNGLGAALMVQGAQAGRALVQRAPGLAVLVAGQDGSVWQSPAMEALLEPVAS
ncbi:MAG: FAD:protein FMN transferase [Acidovorax sp.]|uniref:FAD:protein FMN transferase n=1 Tax=Acidovorax sp. TaxID=1872122 RepID=UPI0022C7287E|nr:FAD:protein FMN transferase [Acidovorax sp.]MCZ8218611.1 FAD:protein FMN transferase [Acidovorax sp.]